MSNIIQSKNDLLILKDILKHFQNNKITKTYLEEVLKVLLPNQKNELLVDFNVKEKGITTASFIPSTKSINISLNKVNNWLDKNTDDFFKNLKSSDSNTLRSYLLLFIITHEIEHSYQYLMGEGIIETPNALLKDVYNGLFELLSSKDYIIPRPIKEARQILSSILYKRKENVYILERNANIESMDLLSKCALYNNREDIYQLFFGMKNIYSRCGYINSTVGSAEETYRQILMYDKYKKFYHEIDLCEDERVRYGFNISKKTRNKILSKYN